MRYRALIIAFLALCLSVLTACSEGPASATTVGALTYDDIRGTGLANKCPQLEETGRGSIPLEPGKSYEIVELCLEPTNYFVKEEESGKRVQSDYVAGKPLTRYTTTLDQVRGSLSVNSAGQLTFTEEEGFDFQPITVQLPGGEQYPFLFTVKQLVASAADSAEGISRSTDFEGDYKVPSYRTSNFLDPKARGLTAGYSSAVALPPKADESDLTKENIKRFVIGDGHISMQVAKVNSGTGEFAGTFVAEQPSDTDMGGKEPADVKVKGIFYGRVQEK